MRLAALLLSALLVPLAGCAGGGASGPNATSLTTAPLPEPAEDAGSVAGTVIDDEERPIAGVEVSLVEAAAVEKSDEGGRFTFNGVAPGSYRLIAQRLGYDSFARKIDVVAGQTANVTVSLKPIAVGLDPYVDVRNYKTLITFGSALLDNRVPLQFQQCTECNRYIAIQPGPAAAQYEATFTNGVSGLPMEDIWFDFRRNWTNATGSMPISDGTTLGNGYLKDRGLYSFPEAGVKDMRANKVSLIWYHVASGFYAPSINKRIDAYVSFAYHGPIPESFSALPPK